MFVDSINTIIILLIIMYIIQLYYNNTKIEKHISQITTFLLKLIVSNANILRKYLYLIYYFMNNKYLIKKAFIKKLFSQNQNNKLCIIILN